MNRMVASKFEVKWGRGQIAEFDKLQDALDDRDYYINCLGGDDDERIPSIYAVLENGMRVLLE